MGIASWHEVKPARSGGKAPRKPTLDEMGPGTESRIYQPKSMTESLPQSPPPSRGGRSTGGAPGHRGGWKKR